MHHAIDTPFKSDEEAELSDVANGTFNRRPFRVHREEGFPWVVLRLLET